jgi:site-specific recombinase XerD
MITTPAKPRPLTIRIVAITSANSAILSGGEIAFKAHSHMLRHACAYALANKGHDTRALQAYLGHRNIEHTVRYTELGSDRFRDFWR